VADYIELLFAEVDRQLADVREQAKALTTRAGLLISVSAVAATVVVANLQRVKTGEILTFIALGAAAGLGVFTIVADISTGPDPVEVQGWITDEPDEAVKALYLAKLITLGGNLRRLARMTTAFYLQGVATLVAVGLALLVAAGR
jgi:hypothetical protein